MSVSLSILYGPQEEEGQSTPPFPLLFTKNVTTGILERPFGGFSGNSNTLFVLGPCAVLLCQLIKHHTGFPDFVLHKRSGDVVFDPPHYPSRRDAEYRCVRILHDN